MSLLQKCKPMQSAKGLTLVECLVAMGIITVALVAGLESVRAARMGERRLDDSRRAATLASDLLNEIEAQAYADGNDTPTSIGPTAAESAAGNRSLFNDVNDYDGLRDQPPRAKDGRSLGFSGAWERQVSVRLVDPRSPSSSSVTDQGLAEVTVEVWNGSARLASLATLRSVGLAATEACRLPDRTCQNLVPALCAALGGTSGGPGSSCWTLAEGTADDGRGVDRLFFTKDLVGSVLFSNLNATTSAWGASTLSGLTPLAKPVWVSAADLGSSTIVLASTSSKALQYSLAGQSGVGVYASICSDIDTASSRPFAAAPEMASGEGLIGYYDRSVSRMQFRTVSAGVLSAAATMGMTTSAVRWVRLTPMSAASDEIMATMVDSGKVLHAARWTGSAWTDRVTLTTALNSSSNEEADVAVEDLSGRLVAVFSDSGSNRVGWRVYTPGSGWSALSYLTGLTNSSRWVRLTSRTGTNEVFLAVMSSNQSVLVSRWNGSAWSSPVNIVSSTGSTSLRGFDIAASADGSGVMVVYGKGGSQVFYRTWTGAAWGGEHLAFTLPDGKSRVILARPGRSGSLIVGAVGDERGGVNAWAWNGSSFGAVNRLATTDNAYSDYQWFAFPRSRP